MRYNHVRGIRHVIKAFGFSMAGFRDALRYEEAFRIELALAVVLAPLAIWLGHSGVQRALMVGSLMLVLITELMNSAVEATVDRISPDDHDLARRAKDIGSAAVFVALAAVPVTWTFVLVEA